MGWLESIVSWYIFILLVGWAVLPMTKRFFLPFVDNGYPFAKTIGILLLSYGIFILGIMKIVPFTRESILFLLFILAFLNYQHLGKTIFSEIWQSTKEKKIFLLAEEILFFLSLAILTLIRSQEPSIRGLEKFMDFGFIQSILRTSYFPPLDIWLSADPTAPAGYPINYYYFGHLTGALLIKLTNITPSVGYNLILATIFAQGITLAFSLSANLVYILKKNALKLQYWSLFSLGLYGLLGALLVNLAGNLHTIYLFTTGYPNEKPLPFWTIFQSFRDITQTMAINKVDFLTAVFSNAKYWYPNATRFIPYTIHEFPSYSYVVADLHGHVFDIPFVLLTFAVILVFFVIPPPLKHTQRRKNYTPKSAMPIFDDLNSLLVNIKNWILALLPASILQTTQRDINLRMVGFTTLFGFMTAIHFMTNAFDGPIYLLLLIILFFLSFSFSLSFFIICGLLLLTFFLFSLPFASFFKPFVSGIGVNCSPGFLVELEKLGPFIFEKGNCQLSPWWMLFVLWGFFWYHGISYTIIAFTTKSSTASRIERFLAVIFIFGTILVLIPEFFYIKDIYPAHFRANTMFKLGYQAYILMSLATVVVVALLNHLPNWKRYLPQFFSIILLVLVLIYPFFAFPSYYPNLNRLETYLRPSFFDGAIWLKDQLPQDKEIIDYLNQNIIGQPVVLEAQGDSYTDYQRISAYTGLPTVAGWWVHEWLWRGSADVVGQRIPDIVNIYESADIELTRQLLKKYQVKYVVISQLERQKYPKLNEKKFDQLGSKIFESNNKLGALYQIY